MSDGKLSLLIKDISNIKESIVCMRSLHQVACKANPKAK